MADAEAGSEVFSLLERLKSGEKVPYATLQRTQSLLIK